MSEKGITHSEAVRKAINSPSSRYWVSPSYVYRDIRMRQRGYVRAGDPVARRKKARACKMSMYEELWRKFKKLKEKSYFKGCSTYFLVSFVINEKAPRFYISYRHAVQIVERMRKERCKKNFKLKRNYDVTES